MQEGLTVEKLLASMKALGPIPPMPFMASSKLFPADYALKFTFENREHIGAHPDFWAKLPPGPASAGPNYGDIPVINLDVDYRRRVAFFEAMSKTMMGATI